MEVDKLSIKVDCHFLNFLCVTPIAAPAIVKELYFPISFLVFSLAFVSCSCSCTSVVVYVML